jgi:hypothetical protein
MRWIVLGFLNLGFAAAALSAEPSCDKSDDWAALSSFTRLKNDGVILPESSIDLSKTNVERIGSTRLGKDLWRQVHHIIYKSSSGNPGVEIITVNNASNSECSETGVEIFVVSKHLAAE